MTYYRWSGAGNTFYIADSWTSQRLPSKAERSQLAKSLCRSFPSAPTDGVLFLEPNAGFDFEWDFYNADGSSAEMCGNAARCATQHFHRWIEPKKEVTFLTLAGPVTGKTLGESAARVTMPRLANATAQVSGAMHVNSGVPHLVTEDAPDLAAAQALRKLPLPAGSNVTFVSKVSALGCHAVTFERGIEDFTLACGTGAVAAAAYLQLKNSDHDQKNPRQWTIEMPGGILKVANAILGSRPTLEGSVQFCYTYFHKGAIL